MAGGGERTRDLRKLAAGWRWRLGYLVGTPVPHHFEDEIADTIRAVRRYTLTSAPRIAALCDAVKYIVENDIEGDLAECGVWRGGSMMAAALTLNRLGVSDRELHGYDTYEGMPEPSAQDRSSAYDGYSIHKRWRAHNRSGKAWAGAGVEEVREAMESTGYPSERIHLIKGMVEETLPAQAPERLALLRLDTDWYASTKHELEQLYPRVSPGGVLIIDDYGHYEGARNAVDEYFASRGEHVLLQRIDWTGRMVLKRTAEPVS
jgi:O-methyltransferase